MSLTDPGEGVGGSSRFIYSQPTYFTRFSSAG